MEEDCSTNMANCSKNMTNYNQSMVEEANSSWIKFFCKVLNTTYWYFNNYLLYFVRVCWRRAAAGSGRRRGAGRGDIGVRKREWGRAKKSDFGAVWTGVKTDKKGETVRTLKEPKNCFVKGEKTEVKKVTKSHPFLTAIFSTPVKKLCSGPQDYRRVTFNKRYEG